jgi:hypothetical protein|tara:strand:+ start:524 stop:679 length:156 start_codon:yes stop_codon:yes gene_type:complete
MIYKKIAKENEEDIQWYFQIEDDGLMKIQCTDQYPPFIEWIAKGNTPEEAD